MLRAFYRHNDPKLVAVLQSAGLAREFREGSGSWLIGKDGRHYLDMSGNFGSVALGYGHPQIVAALRSSLDRKIPHVAPYGVDEASGELARQLLDLAMLPDHKVLYCSSGSEAVRVAVQLSQESTNRECFLSLASHHHGIGWQQSEHLVCADVEEMLRAVQGQQYAAVVIEVCAGSHPVCLSNEEMARLKHACESSGTVFVVDEVLTGLGRTGLAFAFHRSGLRPDIVAVSKVLGAGVVSSAAVLLSNTIYSQASTVTGLSHLRTSMAGNSLALTVGLAVMSILQDEKLIDSVNQRSTALASGIRDVSKRTYCFGDPTVCGLLLRVPVIDEMGKPDSATAMQIVQKLMDHGVISTLALKAPDCIVFTPPLNIGPSEVSYCVEALKMVSKELFGA
jgi:acetylornithine/succinyldiaminopimelate/putrescine aminotransferase